MNKLLKISSWLFIFIFSSTIGIGIACISSKSAEASDITPQTFTEDQREELSKQIEEGVNDLFCIQTDMCSIHVTAPAIQMNVDAFERLIVVGDQGLLNKVIEENPGKSYSAIEMIYFQELRDLEDDF